MHLMKSLGNDLLNVLLENLIGLRIDTGGCSVIRATSVFIRRLISTHQLKSIFLIS